MKDADFRAFIRGERQKLIHYVRSLLRESAAMDAEDLVHDVLLRILEKADLIVPADNPAAYVYRSLKNRAIDYLRTQKPTVSVDEEPIGGAKLIDILRDIRPNALDLLQTEEGEKELFQALEALNEMERKVIIAHDLEGIAFKDLSQRWQVPQNTLLSHKSRAMKKLKQHFLKS